MKKYSISIADDHQVVRQSIIEMLNRIDNFEVVSDASDGDELINKLNLSNLPDVILLDINMPGLDGFDTLELIRKRYYSTVKVLVLSMHDEYYVVQKMLELGTDGFISKQAKLAELEHAIKTVVDHGFYLSPHISRMMVEDRINPKPEGLKITKTDEEILKLVCRQKTNKEIGELLKLSPHTVNAYRTKLLEKTESSSIAGLVVFAMKTGLFRAL